MPQRTPEHERKAMVEKMIEHHMSHRVSWADCWLFANPDSEGHHESRRVLAHRHVKWYKDTYPKDYAELRRRVRRDLEIGYRQHLAKLIQELQQRHRAQFGLPDPWRRP